ncbi:uncharacterized protein AKAW2_50227S [Aspergillus luchuensis]|uniref:Uncharacterized protein n=1 Tax=Aspergillus kawachii TaxID=1069201 RepID=A0A7R7WBG1_ASPKA|nr:uncharacterized protein AKAW2_50227S [Aspergillus luchuensis]BCR99885.1 hypothetical protein AKAW2_50227S [Aspergillus luchuensis]
MDIIFWYVGQGPAYRKYQPTDYFSSLRTIRSRISTGQFFSFGSHVAQAIASAYSMQDLRQKEAE